MGRIVAIDYGTHKTGIAVTDPEQIIANGLTTVDTSDLIDFLKNYAEKESVERFVIGDPKNLDNKPADLMPTVKKFKKKLQKQFPEIAISWIDERFTSQISHQTLYHYGMKEKFQGDKELIDEMSATLILQSYLSNNN